MKQPSAKRQRTLDLQARAIRFSAAVNSACPEHFVNKPSAIVWDQLVRAADSTSNNLVEADDASSDADFLNKMSLALREAKESRTGLKKLSAIFATIIINRKRNIAETKLRKLKVGS